MNIPDDGLKKLLEMTAHTAEHELNCAEAGDGMARYIDFRLTGTGETPDAFKELEQHLSLCPECSEIMEATIAALRAQAETDHRET